MIMKQQKKQLLKKGFTLIEMIIAIAILSIFTLGTATVFGPVLRVYTAALELADARFIGLNVLDTVQNELVYLQPQEDVQISATGTEITFTGNYGKTAITASAVGSEGYLAMSRGETDINYLQYYDSDYYVGNTVAITFTVDDTTQIYTTKVDVVGKDGNTVYSLTGAITPLAALV